MKIVNNKANHEHKKRRKTDSPNKHSESRWSNPAIKFLADFYGIECSEEAIQANSKHVVVQ